MVNEALKKEHGGYCPSIRLWVSRCLTDPKTIQLRPHADVWVKMDSRPIGRQALESLHRVLAEVGEILEEGGAL